MRHKPKIRKYAEKLKVPEKSIKKFIKKCTSSSFWGGEPFLQMQKYTPGSELQKRVCISRRKYRDALTMGETMNGGEKDAFKIGFPDLIL